MNMVEKVVEEKDYDVVLDYMNDINWSGLEKIFEDKYGIKPDFQFKLGNGRYVSINVFSERNLAEKCGILSNTFDTIVLKDFGASLNRIIRYDDDLLQEHIKAHEYEKAESVPMETIGYQFYLNIHFRYEVNLGSNGLPCMALNYTEDGGWIPVK